MDFEGIARAALSQAHDLLPRWFPAGKFLGREFVIGNLAGDPGESLSVNTQTGAWADFSTDERGGDLISLFAAMRRLRQAEAAKQLNDILGSPIETRPRAALVTPIRTPESPEWDGIFPIPEDAPPPPDRHPHHGAPVHVAKYRDVDGALLSLVYRCEPAGQRKQILPLTFCRNIKTGRREWRWQSLPKPRSLYRAELLRQFPEAAVLIVEGERKCDQVNALLPDTTIALSWPNGAKSWKHSDWRMLRGRSVVIWPDADTAGIAAAQQIAEQLPHYDAKVRVLAPPAGVAEGWDVGDAIAEGWDRAAVMAFLSGGESEPPSHERPTIRVINGLLDEIVTQAEGALLGAGFPIYQRGRALVRPISSEVPASRGRMTVAAGLAPITGPAMVDRLCQAARWERFDGRAKDWLRIDPPERIATTLLSRAGDWRFAPIAGVITTPTLRPDGSLLTDAGYDAATRLFHVLNTRMDVRSRVPSRPTREHAAAALSDLRRLLVNFPFVTEVDRSVALSAIVTPVVRGAVSVAPMHVFRANTAGTGKTYMADVASVIATARPCPVATVAKSEEETEKRLAGLLLAAFPLICLDNVNGELGGDLLCQAIERPLVQVRPLGTSEIIEIESRATVFATGNALRVRGDMTRRSLISNLDAEMERPELRTFDFDPVELVLADRARYVAAALTIVMAYAAAGWPDQAPALASFQDWSRSVRSALVWLGCADPCASMEDAREDDPELNELRLLALAWDEAIGTGPAHTVADAIEISNSRYEDGGLMHPVLREAFTTVASGRGGVDSRRLGSLLRKHEGRISNGKRFRKAGMAHGGVVRWQLVDAKKQ